MILVAALAAMVLCVPGAFGSEEAPPKTQATDWVLDAVEQDPAQIREYWTPKRMRQAEPLVPGEGLSAGKPGDAGVGRPAYVAPASGNNAQPARIHGGTPRAVDVSAATGSFPERVHGKVFLTMDQNYVCSATVVRSPTHTLVWTAAHCVHGSDIGQGFATNWMFVPGYRDGQGPWGSWTASELAATQEWVTTANVRLDLGAAVIQRDNEGRGIEDVVGARGIAFNQDRNQVFDAFGYPALDLNTPLLPPNFDGNKLWRCHSGRTANDSPSAVTGPPTMEIECDMTGGSSGGGWVNEEGFVNSVTSYGYEFDANHLYGPYMGNVAEDLYRRAAGKPIRCAEAAATNVGDAAANNYSGTAESDAFVLRGGSDRAQAGVGKDRACGGADDDRLRGGGGADVLRGGAGGDILNGGPGRDRCIGGPGRDRAIGCEVRKGIP
jgi:hypothetical protein